MHDLKRMRTDYTKILRNLLWWESTLHITSLQSLTQPFLFQFLDLNAPVHLKCFFPSIHSNILSPLVQRSFYQGSLQRASCRYDSAGFLKPRGEPGSTLLRGRSNERVLVRLHAGSLLYWKKTRAENRGWFSAKKAWKKRIVRNEFFEEL